MADLAIPDPYGLTASDALTVARERELFPTAMSAREIQEEVPAALRERAVFSARTTNARYLAELKTRVERFLQSGYKGDAASLRVELRRELARLGYTPERGFPGDEELGIPPAEPGSLRDLGSERRINLILETQMRLMTGRAQKAAGLEPLALERYPAWELVRTEERRIPRDWPRRWVEAGGRLYNGRMIALKKAEIWDVIGDPAIFADALGVDHPPFAFASGMGWQQIDEDECLALGVLTGPAPAPAAPPEVKPADLIPDAEASTDGLDAGILGRLKQTLGRFIERAKRITWRSIFGREEVNARQFSRDRRGRFAKSASSGGGRAASDPQAIAIEWESVSEFEAASLARITGRKFRAGARILAKAQDVAHALKGHAHQLQDKDWKQLRGRMFDPRTEKLLTLSDRKEPSVLFRFQRGRDMMEAAFTIHFPNRASAGELWLKTYAQR